MNIFSKNLLYKKEKLLPDEYQQVEYIEANGTQYINTGIYADNNTDWILSMAITGNAHNYQQYLAGGPTNICPKIYEDNGAVGTIIVECGSSNTKIYNFSQNTKYNFEVQGNTLYLDGVSKATFSRTTGSFTYPYWLCSSPYEANLCASMKIYLFKVYNNGILQHDFVPCYRKSDNEVGLYDIVNKTFFTNDGTGSFIKGSDVQ